MDNTMYFEELVDRLVKEESETAPNPFLATRIMAQIENTGKGPFSKITPVLRLAVAGLVLTLAVFAGIATGSLYKTGNTENNAVLIDDRAMEHFGFYSTVADE